MLALTSTSLGERVSELMTNFMWRMLSLADDLQKKTFELMKVLGFKESEMKPFAYALGIEIIAGLTGISKEECFESASNAKIGEFHSKQLWLGLCAFRPYYDTFGEQKALGGKRVHYSNEFSVSEYNDTCHYQIVKAYMKAESGASHPSNMHQIRYREPTFNTNESEKKVVIIIFLEKICPASQ